MLIAVVALIIMLGMLDRALRLGRIETLIMETQGELLALRNHLRYAVVADQADVHHWVFDYLDTSLTKTAMRLRQNATAYDIFGCWLAYRSHRAEALGRYQALMSELDKPNNHAFRAVFEGYEKSLDRFLARRNYFAYPLVRAGFYSPWSKSMPDHKTASIEVVTNDPKLSTLAEFCHL